MKEMTTKILAEISALGKRFLLSEALSIFGDKYSKDQITEAVETAKAEGVLWLDNGVLHFEDDCWKEFFENARLMGKDHLSLALQRDLTEAVKFHFENSGCSKRAFAAALLWHARKRYYEWLPKDKLLKEIQVIDDILGFESWASMSLKARIKALDFEKITKGRLIEKWLKGKFHVDCMNFLRMIEINLDEQHFSELLREKLKQASTEYQKIVLEFFQIDTKNIMSLSRLNIENLKRLNKKLKPISPQYARLKVAVLNLFARYYNIKEPPKFKKFIELALKIASEFNIKDWISKLHNNLSLYYEEDFKAYSEELKLRAIDEATEIGDHETAAFIAINLAYSYLACGEKISLNKLMGKISGYIQTSKSPEIKSRFFEFKALAAVYDGNHTEFEKYIAEYEDIFRKTKDSRVLSKRYFADVLRILFHIIGGNIEKIKSISEKLVKIEYIENDERRFLEIVNIGLEDPIKSYELFKEYRKSMRFYIEETLLFLAQILPGEFLEDFRKFLIEQLVYSRQRRMLLSQAQLYHALGLASNKLDIQKDTLRYMRFAAFLYDASGMDSLSHKLRTHFLQKKAFIDLVKQMKINLENAGVNKELLAVLERSTFNANESLRFIGRLMAVVLSFADAENFNDLAQIIFKSLMEEFPASVGKFEFGSDNTETFYFGTEEIPDFGITYSFEPFYVSYSFYVGKKYKAKLELYNPDQRVDDLTIQKFYDLMAYLEPIVELVLLNFSRYRMAIRDELTGLYTRWYFEERFKEEFSRSNRTGEVFSLIFCDLDDFKKVNDNYGHKVGDEVLKMVAKIFWKNARETDIICRYGGEEFVFLLPCTTHTGAMVFAERLRKSLEEAYTKASVTGSFGVVSYPSPNIFSREEILRIADDLCYKAKKEGKNLVKG
ncbi:hypothetical protein AT15_02680 [Kosmotoga arenicorallina S304]|uniref:GGDEF domain-containing protein n=1 Tax=Kosmotoga arenicorallina S304 TaxID=1453497 RepID=A0A182C8C9_9BACT|nr:GGDEF domain-containing protein [Kosmotoga arenicorallina]OAA31749.1 hypothetical protein AT15_02680 [Kosmotoga arenicorallina S304]